MVAEEQQHRLRMAALAFRRQADEYGGSITHTADALFNTFGFTPSSYAEQTQIERALADAGLAVRPSDTDDGRTVTLFVRSPTPPPPVAPEPAESPQQSARSSLWQPDSSATSTVADDSTLPAKPSLKPSLYVFAPGEPLPEGLRYASWWRRFAAVFVDFLLWDAVVCGLYVAALPSSDRGAAATFAGLIGLLLALFYPAIMIAHRRGQTLGKALVDVRVVRPDGDRVGFGRAFGRTLLQVILGVMIPPVGVLTDTLWASWDPEKRALHDVAAKTRVVRASS